MNILENLYICEVSTSRGSGDVLPAGSACSIDDLFGMIILSEDFSEYRVVEGSTLRSILECNEYNLVNFYINDDKVYFYCNIARSTRTDCYWQSSCTIKTAGSIWALIRELLELDAMVEVGNTLTPLATLSTSRFTNNVFVKIQDREVVNNKILLDIVDIMKFNRMLRFYVNAEEEVVKDIADRYFGVNYQKDKGGWLVSVSMNNQTTFPVKFDDKKFCIVSHPVMVAATQYQIEVCKIEKLALHIASQISKIYYGITDVSDIVSQRRRDIDLEPVQIVVDVSVKKPTMLQFISKLYSSESEMFMARLGRVINDRAKLLEYLHTVFSNINTNGSLSAVFEETLADVLYSMRDGYDPFLIKELAYKVDKQQARLNLLYAEIKSLIYEFGFFDKRLSVGFQYRDLNLVLRRDLYSEQNSVKVSRGGYID